MKNMRLDLHIVVRRQRLSPSFPRNLSISFEAELPRQENGAEIEKSRTSFVPERHSRVKSLNRTRISDAGGRYALSLPFSITGCRLSVRFLAMNRGMMPSASRNIWRRDTAGSAVIIERAKRLPTWRASLGNGYRGWSFRRGRYDRPQTWGHLWDCFLKRAERVRNCWQAKAPKGRSATRRFQKL